MEQTSIIMQLRPDHILEDAVYYDNCGADELFFYDSPSFEEDREEDIHTIRLVCRAADIPLSVLARVKRFEDIKKMIYAGARRVIVDTETHDNLEAVREASKRFGADRIYLLLKETDYEKALIRARQAVEEEGFGGIVLEGDPSENDYVRTADFLKIKVEVPVFVMSGTADPGKNASLLKMTMSQGLIIRAGQPSDCMDLKQALKEEGLQVNTYESSMTFGEFRTNSDGMVPCITQDYKSGEVLMLAYMTKESFEKTIATGKMCYYSRSRQELWTKGETSGHYQYVRALTVDCDKDTLLARVAQVGPACHTGNRTCFFTDLMRREYDDHNPLAVFEQVYDTIMDRKDHPKEGSYTNYLFDKGVDKILKKIGEEATEIVIAAKNPDSEELKYEICDFLYHMMVLMAEQDMSWKEITDELAARH